MSSHPLSEIREQLHRRVDHRLSDLGSLRDGQVVTVGGLVTSLKPFVTRKGDQMVFAELDDATGSVEVVVFADNLGGHPLGAGHRRRSSAGQGPGRPRRPRARSRSSPSRPPFEATADFGIVRLRLDARRAAGTLIGDLKTLIGEFPGEAPVMLEA